MDRNRCPGRISPALAEQTQIKINGSPEGFINHMKGAS